MRATTVTLHAGPEILHHNRSLKYISLLSSKFFKNVKQQNVGYMNLVQQLV
jgi:hypothetical protein